MPRIAHSVWFLFLINCQLKAFEQSQIECYKCSSLDMYCKDRVTDTMVTTEKCPADNKCTVRVSSKDPNYIQRGCSRDFDSNGKKSLKNGCSIDSDGSTLCFCEQNRCNSGSVSDFKHFTNNTKRSLGPKRRFVKTQSRLVMPVNAHNTSEHNQTIFSSAKNDSRFIYYDLDQNNTEISSYFSNETNSTLFRIKEKEPATRLASFTETSATTTKKIDELKKVKKTSSKTHASLTQLAALNKITVEYYPNKKVISKPSEGLTASTPRIETSKRLEIIQKIESLLDSMDIEDVLKLLTIKSSNSLKKSQTTEFLKPITSTKALTKEKLATRIKPAEYEAYITKYFNNKLFSKAKSTAIKETTTVQTTTASNPPTKVISTTIDSKSQLKINPVQSTKQPLSTQANSTPQLPNLTSSYEIKYSSTTVNPIDEFNYHINEINNQLIEDSVPQMNATKINDPKIIKYKIKDEEEDSLLTKEPVKFQPVFTTQKPKPTQPIYSTFEFLSTISGMGLGIVPISSTEAILSPNKKLKTANPYDWHHIFSDEYKEELKIDYKCKGNGLFHHPTICWKFIQCIYFGSPYERFLISNCPQGLYFNEKYGYCDHNKNVRC